MSLLRLVAGSGGTDSGIRKTSDRSLSESDFSADVFFCKECNQPLKIASLNYSCEKQETNKRKDRTEPGGAEDLDSESAPVSHAICGDGDNNDRENDDGGHSHRAEAGEVMDVARESFLVVRNAASPPQAATISHHALVKGCLHDLLSSGSQVQDPLCQDCTDILLEKLEEQLKLVENENETLRAYHEKILAENEGVDEAALDEELKRGKEEEAQLIGQLDREMAEFQQTRTLCLEAEKELRQVEAEEEEWRRKYLEIEWESLGATDDKQSAHWQLLYAEAQLKKLSFPSTLEATFSDLRKFMQNPNPKGKVDLNEINAAWGQAILLLQQLASMVGLQFQRYHLVPNGSRSYIEPLQEKSQRLPLHYTEGDDFSRFQSAVDAFNDCVGQLQMRRFEDINQ